jgi:ABC transporter substrate binding protein
MKQQRRPNDGFRPADSEQLQHFDHARHFAPQQDRRPRAPPNRRAVRSGFSRHRIDRPRGTKGGLIVTSSTLATLNRELIVAIASRHRLPAIYSNRLFVTGGGLLSYSPDRTAQFRQAAAYVDRILKGEKPANLPVQAPVKYELVINLKTARALGLEVPDKLPATADEVIE